MRSASCYLVHEVKELWVQLDTGAANLWCFFQEFGLLSFVAGCDDFLLIVSQLEQLTLLLR